MGTNLRFPRALRVIFAARASSPHAQRIRANRAASDNVVFLFESRTGRRLPASNYTDTDRTFYHWSRLYRTESRYTDSEWLETEGSESDCPETDKKPSTRSRREALETEDDTESDYELELKPVRSHSKERPIGNETDSKEVGHSRGCNKPYARRRYANHADSEEIEVETEISRGSDKPCGRRYDRESDSRTNTDSYSSRSSIVQTKGFSKHYEGSGRRYIRDSDLEDVEIESDSDDDLEAEVERQMAAEPKVTRPSVTWGILLAREQRRIVRETVLQYLEAEGINTSQLTSIELPTTVNVMETRLGFLRKLGLTNDDINNYPLVLGCSVQKNMVPVLKYLNKIGIKDHLLKGFLRKYPMVLHASVVIDILPVIYFLRGLDVDPLDIPPMLTRYPDVLGFKTEGTMSTSVGYLVSMGVKMRHVGRMLTEYPEILGMRVASVIKPKFEYLMSLGIPQSIVARIIERRPHVLGYDLESRMKFNVSQLIAVSVRQEAIPGIVTQFPEILGRVFSPNLEEQLKWLKDNLELELNDIARIIEKMPQAIFLQEEVVLGRIRFLKSQRFTVKEIGLMATTCPQILISNIDESLKANVTFIIRDMKRSRKEIIEYPACLTYGLETRIKARLNALEGKYENCSLEWLLNCSDGEFQKRLVSGYTALQTPEHAFTMGGLLPGRLYIDGKTYTFHL